MDLMEREANHWRRLSTFQARYEPLWILTKGLLLAPL
jgi:hypothetical protein